SGGWNPRPLAPEEFKSYDPEKLEAYEMGVKTRWLDGKATLNLAGFHSKYKDLQLQTNSISPTTGGLILTVDNAGAVSIYGFEAEMLARPVPDLQINASAGYLHNKYTRLAPGTGYSIDAKLPKAPAWTVSLGAQYSIDLPGQSGSVTLRGDYNYRSKTYHDPRNTPSIAQPGYSVVDARLAWSSVGDRVELAVFGRNLANKHYFTSAEWVPAFGVQNMVVGRPREWGASATLRF
ncbi:MAG: TonB-dependent receptor, partial [Sphingobium sp.]